MFYTHCLSGGDSLSKNISDGVYHIDKSFLLAGLNKSKWVLSRDYTSKTNAAQLVQVSFQPLCETNGEMPETTGMFYFASVEQNKGIKYQSRVNSCQMKSNAFAESWTLLYYKKRIDHVRQIMTMLLSVIKEVKILLNVQNHCFNNMI